MPCRDISNLTFVKVETRFNSSVTAHTLSNLILYLTWFLLCLRLTSQLTESFPTNKILNFLKRDEMDNILKEHYMFTDLFKFNLTTYFMYCFELEMYNRSKWLEFGEIWSTLTKWGRQDSVRWARSEFAQTLTGFRSVGCSQSSTNSTKNLQYKSRSKISLATLREGEEEGWGQANCTLIFNFLTVNQFLISIS